MRGFAFLLQKYFVPTAIAAGVLPALAIIFLLVLPARTALKDARGKVSQAMTARAERQARLGALQKSLAFIETLPAHTADKVLEIFPTAPDREGLLQILEDRAAAFGFVLKNLDIADAPDKESPLPQVHLLKLSMGIAGGDYPAFVKFLEGLERTARLTDVTSVNFSSGTGAYTLNARAYWISDSTRAPLALDPAFFESPMFAGLEAARAELKPEPRGNKTPFLK